MAVRRRNPSKRPSWLKTRLAGQGRYAETARLLRGLGLHTVCVEAACPNLGECWGRGAATFLILGDQCTRACRFCNVQPGKPRPPEPTEPERVAGAIRKLGLKYAVLTSVTRDDLPDGGAGHWAAVIRKIRQACPEVVVEVLVPDFRGLPENLEVVFRAGPHVFAHNVETVRSLSARIRPQADHDRSLRVLELAARAGLVTKSGLMVGLGEEDGEVIETLAGLRQVGVRLVTIGQYLQPSARHEPVHRYVSPETFEEYRQAALAMGFEYVASGPLVRSSYHADEAYEAVRRLIAGTEPSGEGCAGCV